MNGSYWGFYLTKTLVSTFLFSVLLWFCLSLEFWCLGDYLDPFILELPVLPSVSYCVKLSCIACSNHICCFLVYFDTSCFPCLASRFIRLTVFSCVFTCFPFPSSPRMSLPLFIVAFVLCFFNTLKYSTLKLHFKFIWVHILPIKLLMLLRIWNDWISSALLS